MSKFVIYHCYGGVHSSVTSAGIYLGLLPCDRVPSTEEILRVPHYDGDDPIAYGHFRFMGRDLVNRVVFVLGKCMLGPHVNRLLIKIAGIFGCAGDIFSIDTTAPINFFMMFGGYVSRALKIVPLGRPLVVMGTKFAYFSFVRLATQSAMRLRKNCQEEEMLLPVVPRKAVFYVCPEGFRYPLLAAGWHARPEASVEELLRWARQQSFTGAIGSVLYVGTTDDRQVYVVGAGREPAVVGRMIKELRVFLGVPQSDCLVLDPDLQPSLAESLAIRGCWRLGLSRLFLFWEERLFRKTMDACRSESNNVKRRIKEGILD